MTDTGSCYRVKHGAGVKADPAAIHFSNHRPKSTTRWICLHLRMKSGDVLNSPANLFHQIRKPTKNN